MHWVHAELQDQIQQGIISVQLIELQHRQPAMYVDTTQDFYYSKFESVTTDCVIP